MSPDRSTRDEDRNKKFQQGIREIRFGSNALGTLTARPDALIVPDTDEAKKLKEEVNKASPSKEELRNYDNIEKIAFAIVDFISSSPDETRKPDGTLDKEAILVGIGSILAYMPSGLREVSESLVDQAIDQIKSNKEMPDDLITKLLEPYKLTRDSSPNDSSNPFSGDSSEDEGTSSPSTISNLGDDKALSKYGETLFKIASEASDIADRLKDLYTEMYDGRGISSAQERAEPGWKPSYLDKQFDLRIMDIEEQSKSRNRALILTMAGIDLRGEMEEARKLISFKTKELRDIGHDPDGFRRTQYQKQSQFLLQSFGLLMQIAPNAFSSKYALNHNAWAIANGINTRSLAGVGSQYPGINTASLIERTDEAGVGNV